MSAELVMLMIAVLVVGGLAVWRDPSCVGAVIQGIIDAWKNRRRK